MRSIILAVAALVAGAVGVTRGVIPVPVQMARAVTALGGDPARVRTFNINPLKAYETVMWQVTSGRDPAALGFHGSPVTIPPGSFAGMNGPSGNAAAIGQNGLNSSILTQVQQNNRRIQDMAAHFGGH